MACSDSLFNCIGLISLTFDETAMEIESGAILLGGGGGGGRRV